MSVLGTVYNANTSVFFVLLASSTVGRGNASARLAQDRNQQHDRVLRRSERWVETMFGYC